MVHAKRRGKINTNKYTVCKGTYVLCKANFKLFENKTNFGSDLVPLSPSWQNIYIKISSLLTDRCSEMATSRSIGFRCYFQRQRERAVARWLGHRAKQIRNRAKGNCAFVPSARRRSKQRPLICAKRTVRRKTHRTRASDPTKG